MKYATIFAVAHWRTKRPSVLAELERDIEKFIEDSGSNSGVIVVMLSGPMGSNPSDTKLLQP